MRVLLCDINWLPVTGGDSEPDPKFCGLEPVTVEGFDNREVGVPRGLAQEGAAM